jgi:hypothetical protein
MNFCSIIDLGVLCVFAVNRICIYSSSMAICMAVATAEQSAESVSIQRHPAERPPTQNVNSVASAERPAGQFGGSISKCATNAVTSAKSLILPHRG